MTNDDDARIRQAWQVLGDSVRRNTQNAGDYKLEINTDDPTILSLSPGRATLWRADVGTPPPTQVLSNDELLAQGWQMVGPVEMPTQGPQLAIDINVNMAFGAVMQSLEPAFRQFIEAQRTMVEDWLNRIKQGLGHFQDFERLLYTHYKEWIRDQALANHHDDETPDRDPRAKPWQSPKFQPKRRR